MKPFACLAGLVAAVAALAAAPAAAAEAPIRTTFVHLAQGVPGVLYEPVVAGPKAAIAIFLMHSSADYLAHPGCTELSRRGYRVLCANNSTSKSGAYNDGVFDKVLLEAKAGIVWLRHYPGVRKVVLLGHSGGGTVMTAYQSIAENGVKACQGPEKIWKCPDSLAGLPPADGIVLADSNWGLAAMSLFSVDPAVVDESSGTRLDPSLDMFNPANGFAAGGSTYSPEFRRKFLTAEGLRSSRLIRGAQDRLAAIEAGQGRFVDDEPYIVPGAALASGNNRLFAQDVRLMSHTRRAWPLLKPDGSVVTEVIRTVRRPENVKNASPTMMQGALKTSVRAYLSTYAIRTNADFGYDEDEVRGVDWTSTYASPPGNVQGIGVPLLALGMTGHWEFLASETIYALARSRDKALAFVEGADHSYATCAKCETHPGQYGDTQKVTYDHIDRWLGQDGRFLDRR